MKSAVSTLLVATFLALLPLSSAFAVVKHKHYASHPLKGTIYMTRRPGGYSYHYVDAINTRRFVDPSMTRQTNGGPFDSGFFFETPKGPFGGTTPYMH